MCNIARSREFLNSAYIKFTDSCELHEILTNVKCLPFYIFAFGYKTVKLQN